MFSNLSRIQPSRLETGWAAGQKLEGGKMGQGSGEEMLAAERQRDVLERVPISQGE
jgi:hypothetical protein